MGIFFTILVVLFFVFYAVYDSKKDEIRKKRIDKAESKLGVDKGYDIGYLVCFGREADGTRMKWEILDVDGSNLLLLKDELLTNTVGDSNYWKILKYLNDDSADGFLGKYFTENERAKIIEGKGSDSEFNCNSEVHPKRKKVFLLSVNECYKYNFCNNQKLHWLLRTPYSESGVLGWFSENVKLSFVAPNGLVNYGSKPYCSNIDDAVSGLYLRPAMWCKMQNSPENEYPVSIYDAYREDFRASYVDKRKVLTFGKNKLGEDVEWIILATQPGKKLIISKRILFEDCYNGDMSEISWETCWLRKLLNDDFLNGEEESIPEQYFDDNHILKMRKKLKYGIKFSEDEKARILEVRNDHHENPLLFTAGGKATNDKVFLLSIKEVNQYFPSDSERLAFNMAGIKSDWWTRSPGGYPTAVTFISGTGHIHYYGSRSYASLGVRPVMWIKVE